MLLSGCAEDAPQLPALSSEAVVLAFGDSLTFGTGAGRDESYPAVLENLSGYPVINAGLPGEVSDDGRERLVQLLDQHKPELTILCHGANDLLRKKSDEQAAANLAEMIRMAKAHGSSVVLIGVPKPGILLHSADFYSDLAGEFSLPFDGEIVPKIVGSPALKSDYIHPNAKGYRLLAEQVFELLVESGALASSPIPLSVHRGKRV